MCAYSWQVPEDDSTALVGKTISIFWPKDKKWYTGTVETYDTTTKKHRIHYADGDEEFLNLTQEKVRAALRFSRAFISRE